MILVALKDTKVVAYQKDGIIDLNLEYDKVVQVPDTAKFGLGWFYTKPAKEFDGVLYFYPPVPFDIVPEPIKVYVDDGNGNPVLVENPEETA